MQNLDELLQEAAVAHGHLCAGQVLGVRMAMLGCNRLGIADPRGKDRKRLVTFVEIDRCATDAIGVVTGCRLGKRALKFLDWGKMAATFVDLESGRAVRICARESSKEAARQLHPEIENKNQQQMLAYRSCLRKHSVYRRVGGSPAGPQKSFQATKATALLAQSAGKASTTNDIRYVTVRNYAMAALRQRNDTISRSRTSRIQKGKGIPIRAL